MGYGIREDRLGELLLKLKINRSDLAVKAGLSPGTMTNATQGKARLETIQQILAAAGETDLYHYLRAQDVAKLKMHKVGSGVELVPLCMFYRRRPVLRDQYYRAAFAGGDEVLYVTIMSRDSFKTVEKSLSPATHLRVLTWNPASEEEIVGFSKHLKEEGDKLLQTQEALEKWSRLEQQNPNIEVRTYDSTPTMQGVIVHKKWAMIELMPYARVPSLRPALLLHYQERAERKPFQFFADAFESLFSDSEGRKPAARSRWFRSESNRRKASA